MMTPLFKRIWASTTTTITLSALCVVGCAPSNNPDRRPPESHVAPYERTSAPALPAGVAREQTPLIPRQVLFGNPDKAAARVSPDGARIAYLAPVDGVLNVWVGPVGDPNAAKPVTADKKRGIRQYHWAFDNKHLLYLQDEGGDENWHVYAVGVEGGEAKDLTPLPKVNAEIVAVSHKVPGEILLGVNDRNEQLHDVYRVNIETGERKLVVENPGLVATLADDDLHVRIGVKFGPEGMTMLRYDPDDKDNAWKELAKVGMEDAMTTQPMGFDKTGSKLYLLDSRDRNTAMLGELDLASGKETTVAENEQSDVSDVMIHPTERTVDAVAFTRARKTWQVIDPAIADDFSYLRTLAAGDVEVTSRTLDDRKWTVVYLMDDGPAQYYLYDRDARKATFLFTNRKSLEGQPLAKMYPVTIRARDGMELISYLSVPVDADRDHDARPDHPMPMVLDVHGGPWGRDDWGFDPIHQLFANRGYAVLSVNFRGSTGFGKAFINAANKEWAGKMHEDLLDAVNWAVSQRIADPKRVAIMGGSYGGYATLVGLTFTPDTFACGVDIVGPSNLVTLLNNVPPYWAPMLPVLKDRVGDPSTPEGQKFLSERSPLSRASQIKRPLLIGQGANDPRVKKAEAEQIVNAMKEKNIPVTYVVFPDEGHGFARPENNLAFFAVAEAFLAENLGGRYEAIDGAFSGSSITVPEGGAGVPGLKEALAAMPSAPPATAPESTSPQAPAPQQPAADQPQPADAPKAPDAPNTNEPPPQGAEAPKADAPKTADAPEPAAPKAPEPAPDAKTPKSSDAPAQGIDAPTPPAAGQ